MGSLLDSSPGVPDKDRIAELWIEKTHYFPRTTYATFQSHVLPIAESELTADQKVIYEDPKLTEYSRARLRRFDYWARACSTAVTVIIPWEVSRAATSFRLWKSFDPEGLNYMNKYVLLLALCIYLPLYPFTSYLSTHLPIFNFSNALTSDFRNEQLSFYRKRLLEARPDLLTRKYEVSRLMTFDDVQLQKPQELSMDPDTQAT